MSWAEDEALRCVKCGFCLQACPTYRETGVETHSPRGRLRVMSALLAGEITAAEADPALDPCLGCRACEPVCPSGIAYGRVLETARTAIAEQAPARGGWTRRLIAGGLTQLLPYPRRLQAAASGLRFLRRVRLADWLAARLPGHLAELMRAVPEPPSRARRRDWQRSAGWERLAAGAGWRVAAVGTPRFRVAFFAGCVMDAVFWDVNRATVAVLQQIGCEVIIPETTCCGALHAHTGLHEEAVALGRTNVDRLSRAEAVAGPVAAVITNAGGCGAHLAGYEHLLGAEDQGLGMRVRDLAQWVEEIGLGEAEFSPLPAIVTYQESCHLANGQRVRQQPRHLLQAIPGLQLVEMAEAAHCCGSAGIYNVTHPAMAGQLLEQKVRHIRGTGARIVVTANPGCHLQLVRGLSAGPVTPVVHIAELLAESLTGCGGEFMRRGI